MANFTAKDAGATTRSFKSSGAGTDGDPFVPEKTVSGIPTTVGQKARAAALGVTLSTEDAALLADLLTSTAFQARVPALGQALAAASLPVVLPAAQITTLTPPAAITGFATEATLDARTGALTETAPATDTASSGLNGRLQRIAQRLSSLIALLPTALGANGGLKIEGVASGTVVPVGDGGGSLTVDGSVTVGAALPAGTNNIGDVDIASIAAGDNNIGNVDIASAIPAGTNNIGDVDVLTVPADPFGANADASVAAGAAGSIQAKLRRATQGLEDLKSLIVLAAGTNNIGDVDVLSLPALPAGTNNIGDVDVLTLPALAAGSNIIGKVQPFDGIIEGGLTELIGINEQVDQNEYSDEVGVALAGTYSGEILAVTFYSTEDGSGSVQTPSGRLLIFDANPNTTTGDTTITAASWMALIGQVDVGAGDWVGDTNGRVAHRVVSVPFHAIGTLYFVFKREDAGSFNDSAGDDEQLEFNMWYRRDS
jgi:hypothetical protein